MKYFSRFSALSIVLFSISFPALSEDGFAGKTKYVCPPCYHVKNIFETEVYPHDGQCPICGMNLIERHDIQDNFLVQLHTGSGNFYMKGGGSRRDKSISVFYHKPRNFNSNSKILLVVPGAGRSAWDYRDSWVRSSEAYNVLILSPAYFERDYDFAAYHLGGIVSSIDFKNYTTSKDGERINKYKLKDSDLVLGAETDPEHWIFPDFDRIFDSVILATGSNQQKYDIFGHSAGGQILHRMAIFNPKSKANRIVAANSGSYTLPSYKNDFPFGLGKTKFDEKSLDDIFSVNLTLLIGENDNSKETKGTMLHTPILDRQGLGRLSRGRYFYEESRKQAQKLNAKFNWEINVVENVGHNYEKMGEAAAKLLYSEKKGIK